MAWVTKDWSQRLGAEGCTLEFCWVASSGSPLGRLLQEVGLDEEVAEEDEEHTVPKGGVDGGGQGAPGLAPEERGPMGVGEGVRTGRGDEPRANVGHHEDVLEDLGGREGHFELPQGGGPVVVVVHEHVAEGVCGGPKVPQWLHEGGNRNTWGEGVVDVLQP